MAAACALAAIVAIAAAEDATEATTFGQDGVASQSLGIHFKETRLWSVGARSDGSLVTQRDDRVESYLANGAPDPAAPPQQVSQYRRVFLASDGKSLVLDDSKLTRVNSDGSVDTSFGGGAVEVTWNVSAAAELPSGKILVAGMGWGGTKTTITWIEVQLFNPDGSIDRAVGKDGILTLSLTPLSEESGVREIAPTADGGALVSGRRFLLKLRADGSPDPDFGGDGLIDDLPDLAGAHVLPDGSVAAVGSGPGPGDEDLLVLHYTAAGTLDSGFGDDGIRRFDLGGDEKARIASWAADGSVIVGGSVRRPNSCSRAVGCEEEPMLAAFQPGGGLEPEFGTDGVLRLATLAGPSQRSLGSGIEILTRRADGSIAAAGSSPPQRTTAFLAAVSPRGELLPGFGEAGIVRLRRPAPASQRVTDIAPLANGKLLAAGTTDVGIEDAPVLIRYAADGSLDRSFGGSTGYVVVDNAPAVHGFALDDSGQVLMSLYGLPRSRLLKLRASDGAREPSFGDSGVVSLPGRMLVEAVGLAADGGAIVVGTHGAHPSGPSMVLRYRRDGRPTRRFGQDGRVELRTPGGREVRARALVAGSGGRIFVAGVSRDRFAIAKLLPDGGSDPQFSLNGWVLAKAGGSISSVALGRSGSHVHLAGVVLNGERRRVILLRFNADGRLDHTFGRDGRLTASISRAAEPRAILPSRNGVLVVLSRGSKPLLLFRRGGEVRRHSVSRRPQLVRNMQATVSRGHLILGWNEFSAAIERDVHYLARRPLGAR